MGLEARCFASTQNIVLMFPLLKQDSESAKEKWGGGMKAPEEWVRQTKESELNEVEQQHMNCG